MYTYFSSIIYIYIHTVIYTAELWNFEFPVISNSKWPGSDQCTYIQTQLCFVKPAYIRVLLILNALFGNNRTMGIRI